ncbi:hypothetical protein X743_07460 [Mesorhizobium sp. LNHC252B00]|nr:hypothetical protein X743_07460 [Mesorhizobium sp. LNHC252B00]
MSIGRLPRLGAACGHANASLEVFAIRKTAGLKPASQVRMSG